MVVCILLLQSYPQQILLLMFGISNDLGGNDLGGLDLGGLDLGGLDLGLLDFSTPKPVFLGPVSSISDAEAIPEDAANPDSTDSQVVSAIIDKSKRGTTSSPLLGRWLWTTAPSWLISTVVHVAVILTLAAWHIEPITKELRTMLTSVESTSDADSLDDFSLEEAMSSELVSTDSEEAPSESPTVGPTIAEAAVDVSYSDVVAAKMPAITAPSMTQSLIPKSGIAAQANVAMRAGLNGRSNETKRDLLSKFGGSSDTEKAVSLALKWLALHQDPQSGAWTLAHNVVCKGQCDHPGERRASFNAATGLALMCFLGAGQTHKEGEYKETVFKGLSFLISNMKFQQGQGSWYVGSGSKGQDDMYAHGIACIAMCEAYGMTKDPALRDAAQAGINFIGTAQNSTTGGWHYAPQGLGDTSVVGWQMMALKSGAMCGFSIDLDVVRKANYFLDQMSFDDGASYHYDFNSKNRKAGYNSSTTACAVLCRMYSGMPKDHPSIQAAVAKFNSAGPSKSNTYYNYYATQVMKQVGGKEWESWNVRMRGQLLATQTTTGHAAGSWFWDDRHSTDSAGRLYTTCMATMILEVYYRYLPLYNEQALEDAFKL